MIANVAINVPASADADLLGPFMSGIMNPTLVPSRPQVWDMVQVYSTVDIANLKLASRVANETRRCYNFSGPVPAGLVLSIPWSNPNQNMPLDTLPWAPAIIQTTAVSVGILYIAVIGQKVSTPP